MLVMQGVPAVAVTSEDVFFVSTTLAHTPEDTVDKVDPAAVAEAARFFADVVRELATPAH